MRSGNAKGICMFADTKSERESEGGRVARGGVSKKREIDTRNINTDFFGVFSVTVPQSYM